MKIMNDLFAFTLYTKSVLRVNCCIFDTNGWLNRKNVNMQYKFEDSCNEF